MDLGPADTQLRNAAGGSIRNKDEENLAVEESSNLISQSQSLSQPEPTPQIVISLLCKQCNSGYSKKSDKMDDVPVKVEESTDYNCSEDCDKSSGKECSKSSNVYRNYRGIFFSLVSGLASTFGGIIVRHMKGFHPFTLATFRFQGILLPTLVVVLYYKFVRKENIFHSVWPLTNDKDKRIKFGFTIIRAIIGCIGLYLYFYAVQLMPLADAKIIGSCRTVFVIFAAHLFLGESCRIFQVVASVIALIGVGIISRPPILTGSSEFDSETLLGTMFATSSMLTATLSMVVLRYLRGVHVAIVTLGFGLCGTILSILCSVCIGRFDMPKTTTEWVLIGCLAASTFFSQTAITLAMKYEHAGAVVIVGTCDTIFAFVIQYFILNDAPDKFSVLGASLIILCISLITLRKWVSALPEQHFVRKHLWFVLK